MRLFFVSIFLLIALSFTSSKLFGQTSANDTVCVSSENTEVFVLLNDSFSNDVSIEISQEPVHGNATIPTTGDRIWYTASSTGNLPSRAGKDSLKYKITNSFGESEATVYFNTNAFDLPLSSLSSVCTANPNKVLANFTSVNGSWIFNPAEIDIDFPTQSNSSGRLTSSFSQISWIDNQYNCPSIDFTITNASLVVELNTRGRIICDKNDTTLLRNVYDQPLKSSPFGTEVTHNWILNNVTLNGDSLIPSNFGEGKFKFSTEFNTPVCFTSLIDSVEIIKLSADFKPDSIYCTSSDTLFLNDFVSNPETDPNSVSTWYINDVEQLPELKLNTPGTYLVDHVVTTLHCKDSVRKKITVYDIPDSDFINPLPFYCDNNETLDLFASFMPNTVGGTWLVNDNPPISSNELVFSQLNGGQTNKITYITGTGICSDTTTKNFFLDTLPEISILPLNNFYCNDQSPSLDLSTLNPFPSNGQFWFRNTLRTDLDFSNLSGTDSVTYKVQSANGACKDSISLSFSVDTLQNPSFTPLANFYCNDQSEDIILNELNPQPLRGSFLVNNVNQTTIDFTNLSGINSLKYVVSSTNNACRDSIVQSFTVDTLQEPSFDPLEDFYCNDQSTAIVLNNLNPLPVNGNFLLNDLIISTLDFSNLSDENNLKYTVTSPNGVCNDTLQQNFIVDTLAEPNFNELDNFYCNDEATAIPLNSLNPFPQGGNFLLNDLVTSTLDFSNLFGNNELKYTVSSPNGICKDTILQSFIVDTLAEPSFDPLNEFYCNDEATAIPLNSLNPFPQGGNFLLNDLVTSTLDFSNLFGNNELKYTVSSPNGICKDTLLQSFIVDTLAEPSFDPVNEFYCNDNSLDLELNSLNALPEGGTFFLNDTEVSNIEFLNLSGDYELNYIVASSNNICRDTSLQTFTVDTLSEPNFDQLNEFYCNDETSSIDLNTLNASPSGGDFLLNNSIVTTIDFRDLFGNYELRYRVSSNNNICNDSIKIDFVVDTLQEPIFDELNNFYCNDTQERIELNTLNALPAGGTFLLNNTAVSQIDFEPLSGNYNLEYLVSSPNNICKDTTAQTFTVDTLQTPRYDLLNSFYCNDQDENIVLTSLNPEPINGIFTLNNTNTTEIDFINLSGEFTLKYLVTSDNNICVDSTAQNFRVDTLAVPSFGNLSTDYCDSDNKINLLSTNPFPTENIDSFEWFVNENKITDSLDFSDLEGVSTLTYVVSNGTCLDSTSFVFNVDTLGTPEFILLSPRYCDDNERINVNDLSPFPISGLTNSVWFLNDTPITEISFSTLFDNQTLKYVVENGVCKDSVSQSFTVDTLLTPNFDTLENRYCNNQNDIIINSLNAEPSSTTSISVKWELNNEEFFNTAVSLENLVGTNNLSYIVEKGACLDSISRGFTVDEFSSSKWEMDTLLCSEEGENIVLSSLSSAVGSAWDVESTNEPVNGTISLSDSATYVLNHSTVNGSCTDSSSKVVTVFLAPDENTFDSIADPLCRLIQNVNLDNRIEHQDVFSTSWVVMREIEDYVIPNGGIMDLARLDPSHNNVLTYTLTNENSQTPEKCTFTGRNYLNITQPTDTILRDTVSLSLGTDSVLVLSYDPDKQRGISDVPAQLDITANETNDSLLIKHLQFAIPGRLNSQSIKLVSSAPLSCEVPIIYKIDFEAKIKLQAGTDILAKVDEDCVDLAADVPNFGAGSWSADPPNNVVIEDPSSPISRVCFINKENTQLSWNITSNNQDTTGTISLLFDPLRISQGFSPNDDGINDEFEVVGLSPGTKIAVTIFNRWGQIVFETNDYQNNRWSGNNTNGEVLPNDSYIYNIEIEGIIEESGTVILRK